MCACDKCIPLKYGGCNINPRVSPGVVNVYEDFVNLCLDHTGAQAVPPGRSNCYRVHIGCSDVPESLVSVGRVDGRGVFKSSAASSHFAGVEPQPHTQ